MGTALELTQLVKDLQRRVAELEKRVAPEVPAVTIITPVVLDTVKKPERKMCPKCGVKPNHFFHVKTCKGQQKEQKNGEDADRRRDQSTT